MPQGMRDGFDHLKSQNDLIVRVVPSLEMFGRENSGWPEGMFGRPFTVEEGTV